MFVLQASNANSYAFLTNCLTTQKILETLKLWETHLQLSKSTLGWTRIRDFPWEVWNNAAESIQMSGADHPFPYAVFKACSKAMSFVINGLFTRTEWANASIRSNPL